MNIASSTERKDQYMLTEYEGIKVSLSRSTMNGCYYEVYVLVNDSHRTHSGHIQNTIFPNEDDTNNIFIILIWISDEIFVSPTAGSDPTCIAAEIPLLI